MPLESPPDYPSTFWALIEQRAAATPDRTMLEDDRGRSLTFAGYRDTVLRVAAGLRGLGIHERTPVSWQLPTSIDGAVLQGALSRLGAVQNPVIPILRRREVGFIVGQTGARFLIVPGVLRGFDHAAMAREIAAETGCEVLVWDRDAGVGDHGLALPDGDPSTLPAPSAVPDDPARHPVRWVYYSSGTTADPKGVRHTDWSVMNAANGTVCNQGMEPDDCYPIAWPITHVGGAVMMTGQLVAGCRYVLIERYDVAESPRFMAEVGATLLGSAVPFFHAYIAAQRQHGPEPLFPKLRFCVGGGAPKPPELHYEVKEVLGGGGILSGYGLTEFPIATTSSPTDTDEQLAQTEGLPAPRVDVRVVDASGRDLGRGEEGELRLQGPQMFRGYLDEALNEAAFDERGYFRTGDLGVVEPSGHVRITGRLKDIIIRNAENISAQEIEDVVYTHPKVADVAVVGVPDPRTGERACAVVVLGDGETSLTLQEVVEHCRSAGLANQKLPEQLELIEVLPRNAMGKVLKQELRRRLTPA